jgi:hypothetical protein
LYKALLLIYWKVVKTKDFYFFLPLFPSAIAESSKAIAFSPPKVEDHFPNLNQKDLKTNKKSKV